MKISPSYSSILHTATVAGIFSALVGIVLVAGFITGPTQLALDEPRYRELKLQLEKTPTDAVSQEQLRVLDARLRRRYFQHQIFQRRGSWLLAGGVAATLLFAHWATTVRRRLPRPKSVAARRDLQARSSQLSRWGTGGMAVVLLTIVVGLRIVSSSSLPSNLQELAAAQATLSAQSEEQAPRPLNLNQPDPNPEEGQAANALKQRALIREQFALSWPCFRGVQGAGISAFQDVPTTWDGASGEGILWKTPIPLPGVSSPIVWQDRVFVTGATQDLREVYCLNAEDGQILWHHAVGRDVQNTMNLRVSEDTGFAAPTPATDGERVYATFARGDLVAFDLNGSKLWYANLGTPENLYGHASSLTTYEDLLIVQFDQGTSRDDKSRLMALRGATGKLVWEVERAVPVSWSTPIVVRHADQAQVITSSAPWVIAYAAEDGSEIWRASCMSGEVGPSPVYDNGMVYVANENAVIAAIDAGGLGDVTESHIRWTADYALPDICSPLVVGRHVLLATSYGTLASYEREEGNAEPLWEEELDGVIMASPSRVGNRVYLISDDGKGCVLQPGDTDCEKLAENDLGERCFASPAFQSGRIYIRGEQHLFCVGRQL